MIYLGQPYSTPDLQLLKTRVTFGEGVAAALFANGYTVYAPICAWHHIVTRFEMPSDAAHWERQNFPMIDLCEEFFLLALPGWHRSKGLEAELRYAIKALKPIKSVMVGEFPYDTERHVFLLPTITIREVTDLPQLLRYFRANDHKEPGPNASDINNFDAGREGLDI